MENQKLSRCAALHYLSAIVILTVYGVQVCPFLETLTVLQLLPPILLALGAQFILRGPLGARFVNVAPYQKGLHKSLQPRRGAGQYFQRQGYPF